MFVNVCRFTATSSGTGDFVVSAAVTGYQTPASAGAVNGTVYRYRAESADLSQWEIGFGSYTSASTTLARSTVIANSSGTTAKINFSAAPQVSIVVLKEDLDALALPGHIYGLTLSKSAATTVGIATGIATDTTEAALMRLSSAYTKTFSSWAVGTGNGGLDTGSIANSTWYHVWLIQRSDTGVVDVLISTSASAPTMPTSYDRKRRIGSIKTDATPNIIAFTQDGDYFVWSATVLDVDTTNPGTSAVTSTLTVPTGVNVRAGINLTYLNSTLGGFIYVSDLAASDEVPSATAAPLATAAANPSVGGRTSLIVRTDTSAQVRYRSSSSDANTTVRIATLFWLDTRGK